MLRYLDAWWDEILTASQAARVPVSLLLMTLATENGPARVGPGGEMRYRLVREEPGYVSDEETPHRVSVGPCHLLISTARSAMGEPSIGRAWLSVPGNNLLAAARYIAAQRADTGYDPILTSAAYNAGGLYPARPGSRWHNDWHLRTYGNHLNRAAAWYGDACAVISSDTAALSVLDRFGLGRVVRTRAA